MAKSTPIITCVKGRYQPQAPNTYVCAPAVALIVTSRGEVEVFSKDNKCNQKILDVPYFGGEGHSIDLLDEQLVLLGDKSQLNGKFEYKSIHHPRKGLLGMKFSNEISPAGSTPLWHTSHVYGNQLLAIGGDFGSKAKLSSTLWTGTNLRWQNGTQFSRTASGACGAKVTKDVFLLIGGFQQVKDAKVEMNLVLRLNITSEVVEELPSIKLSRAFHACEVFEGNIFISGGTNGGIIIADEVYNLTSKESTILSMTSSLKRKRHVLQLIEGTVFALGGLLGNHSETASIEWFDWIDMAWKGHDHSLLSEHTSSISITSFPLSSVDCHTGCQCGVTSSFGKSRIVGGSDAEVQLSYHSDFKHLRRKTFTLG